MNIAENLDYSYEEQCFLQLRQLKVKLIEDDYNQTETKRLRKQRLFRYNIYENIEPQRRRYLDRIFCYILKSIGDQLHSHLTDSLQQSSGIKVVDRRDIKNYFYDRFGVIHLKPKNQVKMTRCTMAKQAILLHIVSKVLKLVESGGYMTKRELYYLSLDFCRTSDTAKKFARTASSQTQNSQPPPSQSTQSQLNSQSNSQKIGSQNTPTVGAKYNPKRLETALDDLCCLIGCSKVHLHVLTQSKCIVYGDLKFRLKTGEFFDCSLKKEGTALPTAQVPIVEVKSGAEFVLILEKDSVLQKILNQEESTNFVKNYKVILITSKGYPDINTRAFLKYLWSKLKIPMLVLTDADPYGFEIACSYKFGSFTTAYEGFYLSLPQVKWLGLLPSDINRLALPEQKTIPLSDLDMKKIDSLLHRSYLKPRVAWLTQLNILKESGRKAELESLDSGGEYLVRTYLPNKLRYASWL